MAQGSDTDGLRREELCSAAEALAERLDAAEHFHAAAYVSMAADVLRRSRGARLPADPPRQR